MLVKKMFVPLMLLMFVMAGATVASAQWERLGDKDVAFTVDHDTVDLPEKKGYIKEVRFSVEKAPVNFKRVLITFRDGEKMDVEFLEKLVDGGESRAITLEGANRSIKRIDFWYETATPSGKQAKVIVWGQ
jgi:hypothetical protein